MFIEQKQTVEWTMDTYSQESLLEEIESALESAEAMVTDFYGSKEIDETPNQLFHYTDDVGMRSILESGNLWMTDVFSMNDPSEIYYGISYAASEIEKAANISKNYYYQLFASRFLNVYSDNLHRIFHMFVTSFSNSGEKLDQWRAYADDGRGYALVFDGASLDAGFIANNKTHNSTTKIDYESKNLAKIQDPILNLYMPIIGKLSKSKLNPIQVNKILQKISVNLSFSLLQSGLFFKHEAYANEEEFRFCQLHAFNQKPANLKVRYQPHRTIKYVEFDWKMAVPQSLRKIIIGPSANKERSLEFVHTCLEMFGLTHVDVEISRIPYRSSRL